MLNRNVGIVSLMFLAAVLGCGGGDSASVRGKVTFNGSPVTEGTLQFQPIASSGNANPGMPAAGELQSDGSYVLGRESKTDGAVLGKHKVVYMAPPAKYADPANAKPGELPTPSQFAGLVPKTTEVEVKSGGNTLDIELVAPAPVAGRR
jgi:hypothetical protein